MSGPIYLALLQRPGDSQLVRYSTLGTVAAFIEHVVASFAQHAPAGVRLLFKAHPLDHGIEPHEETLRRAAARWGVSDRVHYTDVGHFPSLVRASVGVVSVNSTGGLTAIEFQKPTAVLGQAIYDLPGLTHQSGLDRFWTAPEAPDPALYRAFRNVVMARTQINGAYSTRHGVRLAAPRGGPTPAEHLTPDRARGSRRCNGQMGEFGAAVWVKRLTTARLCCHWPHRAPRVRALSQKLNH